MMRVDRLEAQIRQLTGVIEQLQYRNQQLEAYVRRMQEEGGAASVGTAAPASPAGAVEPGCNGYARPAR